MLGVNAPTNCTVLRKLHGHHEVLQKNSGGTSSYNEAYTLNVLDVIQWWSKTGIDVKAWQTLSEQLEKLQKH